MVSADEIGNVEALAIQQVKQAEIEGEKKGKEEAQKLLSKMRDLAQNNKESKSEVNLLQAKFEQTSGQVTKIITNFNKVHNDLLQLKDQYTKQKEESLLNLSI